jgi:hypothetical protein
VIKSGALTWNAFTFVPIFRKEDTTVTNLPLGNREALGGVARPLLNALVTAARNPQWPD